MLADGKKFEQFPNISDENKVTLNNSWLVDPYYWTQTISSAKNSYSYVVGWNAIFLRHYNSHSFGVRPVITTLKSNLFEK